MKNNIPYFIKFGEKEFLENIPNGELYFSTAKDFQKIEEEQYVTGQGDKYDGIFRLPSYTGQLLDVDNNTEYGNFRNRDVHLTFQHIEKKPIFCIAMGRESNCYNYKSLNNYNLRYTIDSLDVILKQFPKTNAALIIPTPDRFVNDICDTFSQECLHGEVGYFDMKLLTMDRVDFLFGRNKRRNRQNYVIDDVVAHRTVLCKDNYFSEQNEYRFICKNRMISGPKTIKMKKNNSKYRLVDFEELVKGVHIIL